MYRHLFSPSCIYIWNMKAVCWKLPKLLSQKQSADRQTNLIPIGHPPSGRALIKVVIKAINLGVIWRNFTNIVIVLNMKSLSLAIRKFCPRCDVKKGSPKRLLNGTKINNTSSHMLLDHCYAFSLLLKPCDLKRKVVKKRSICDLFLPHPGSILRRVWPKNNNTYKGPWELHPFQLSWKSIKRL